MALHGGDILDLMGRIQDAGYRAPCASSGAWMWGAAESTPSQQLGGNGNPARWQTLRGVLLRATIVVMAGVAPVATTRPQVAHPATEIADQPTSSSAQNAIAQNAAQAQAQTQSSAPTQAAISTHTPQVTKQSTQAAVYPHTPQVSPPRQDVQRIIQPGHAAIDPHTPQVSPPRRNVGRIKQPTQGGDQPSSPDGLDPEIVRRYVRRNDARIKYCYEMRRLVNPALAGSLETHFVILSSGVVASARAVGLDHEIADCVVDVIRTIEFPSSASDTRVKYPFHFMPADN
jgi:hypothetical protein